MANNEFEAASTAKDNFEKSEAEYTSRKQKLRYARDKIWDVIGMPSVDFFFKRTRRATLPAMAVLGIVIFFLMGQVLSTIMLALGAFLMFLIVDTVSFSYFSSRYGPKYRNRMRREFK